MKMANIDAVFDFMFSHPKSKDGVSHSVMALCVTYTYCNG